ISKTAAGGEIDALDPAGYGALTITKAITIDGGGGQVASVLVAGTNGIVVQAGPSDTVILRNLRINGISGSGNGGINGIRFLSGKALSVESCDIFDFTTNGLDIASAGGKVFVTDSTFTNNGGVGVSVQSTALTTVSINNSRFESNNNGVTAGSNSKVSITNSAAYGNASVGFLAAAGSGTADMNISNSTAGNNNVGIQAGGAAGTSTIRINGVSINGNSIGLATGSAGSIRSFGNNANADSGLPSGPGITPQ
ncbi:MAG TPA: right-handed parallel beta-helix repeat-containing protein, partial [Candidatus Angelobacter sp.]|nr:right-handed parallel beta-helix repeat-containing protein [Candidatus Angelobacter sp.]